MSGDEWQSRRNWGGARGHLQRTPRAPRYHHLGDELESQRDLFRERSERILGGAPPERSQGAATAHMSRGSSLLLLLASAAAEFSEVVDLTTTNWERTSDGSPWLLEFYAPWWCAARLLRSSSAILRRSCAILRRSCAIL